MERPRRNPRPPGALSDYLTVVEAGEKSIGVEESIREQQQQQQQQQQQKQQQQQQHEEQEEQVEAKDASQTEMDRKFLLSQPYKCKECKARYRSRVALLRHAVKHNGEKRLLSLYWKHFLFYYYYYLTCLTSRTTSL